MNAAEGSSSPLRDEARVRVDFYSERSVRRQVNPHPDGFAAACKRVAAANDRACLKCHTEASLAGRGCR
ncbi:hypothetical protein ACN28I_02735 [Archangium gephyra]|uniref:hypothetical protein n=1 Tax=Archangium gephyra TaxID=48 RepID=UPI003B7DDD55